MLSLVHLLNGFLILASAAFTSAATVSTVYEFPSGTWVENIAVRKNGNIVVILYDRPEIHEINPFASPPTAQLVARFDNATGLLGISETASDSDIFGVMPFVGSDFALWTVDLGSRPSGQGEGKKKEIIPRIEGVGMLNGMTRLKPNTLLASDTKLGSVVRFEVAIENSYAVAIEDPTMAGGVPFLGAGINGIRVHDDHLYYTNSFKAIVCRVPIAADSATRLGPVQLMGTDLKMLDDLAIDEDGTAYAMQWLDGSVVKVDQNGSAETIAQGLDHPTSAQFGRTDKDKRVLYVSGSGNPLAQVFKGYFDGGKVYAIHLD